MGDILVEILIRYIMHNISIGDGPAMSGVDHIGCNILDQDTRTKNVLRAYHTQNTHVALGHEIPNKDDKP